MLFKSLFTLALPLASFALPTFLPGSESSIDIAAKRHEINERSLPSSLPHLPSQDELSACRAKHKAPKGAVPISVILVQVHAQVKTVCGKLTKATTVDIAAELVTELLTIIHGAVDKLKALKGCSKEFIYLDVDLKVKLTASGIAKLCSPIFEVILKALACAIVHLNLSLDFCASTLTQCAEALASFTTTLCGLVTGFLAVLVVELQGVIHICFDLKLTAFIQVLGVSNSGSSGHGY